jgi:hypothetical protein
MTLATDKIGEVPTMIQQFLALLPRQINSLALAIAIAGAVLGGLLWLGGSRFSRTLMTLISVSTGGLVGLQLPRWFGWGLEGWATAVLGALVLGISGYVLHKLWVGLGLGLVLAVWAAMGTLLVCADPKGFVWPVGVQGSTLQSHWVDLWNSLTPEARKLLPFACCAGLLSGICATLLWPRLGIVLLYSTAGISLLVGLGTTALYSAKREWLNIIPSKTSSQLILLFSMVAFGAVLQWRCIPSGARVRSSDGRR